MHSTVVQVPAHSLVRFTIYNYDGASGLRNPLWSQPRGTVGGTETIDGKPYASIDPTLASHTFAIPDMGVSVALPGVADDAPNQCTVTPCQLSMAHYTITFTIRTAASPATTAGSASSPAPPGSPTASAVPCRTLAGWTATSMSPDPGKAMTATDGPIPPPTSAASASSGWCCR